MWSKNVLGWALSFALIAALAAANDDSEREQTLRGELEHFQIANLKVDVLGKMATLDGTAESLFQTRQATKLAKNAQGIESVFNNLHVVEVSDGVLERSIRDELEKDRHYTIYDAVTPSVTRGRVTLTGSLAPGGDPREIEEIVSKVRGVRSIENEVRVLPYSAADERLRLSVVVSVLDELRGKHLADDRIHIVVENGRVTLEGTVPDNEVRRLVENIARGTDGALTVENRLTLESGLELGAP